MQAVDPNADVRDWLARNPEAADPYTRLRIEESFEHIESILAAVPGTRRGRVLDVGSGTAFNSFALARHFDHVTGMDTSRRRVAASRKLVRRVGAAGIEFARSAGERY